MKKYGHLFVNFNALWLQGPGLKGYLYHATGDFARLQVECVTPTMRSTRVFRLSQPCIKDVPKEFDAIAKAKDTSLVCIGMDLFAVEADCGSRIGKAACVR